MSKAALTSKISGLLLLVVLALILVFNLSGTGEVKDEDILSKLAVFVALAVIGGIVFVTVILPMLSEGLGGAMFGGGERVKEDPARTAARLAQEGDIEGAIAAYKKAYEAQPEVKSPLAEIARLQIDQLGDIDGAEKTIRDAISVREWSDDDSAFFYFRLVDISIEHRQDYANARQILEQVQDRFPETRYSANAAHKIREIEEMEFRAAQEGGGDETV